MRGRRSTGSKVAYDLRPAKQVERRMMLYTFQLMSRGGFHIGDYQYTGFGSFTFVDFILFYKFLGVDKLWSIEHDISETKRVKFNKPFRNIQIKMDSVSAIIPQLSRDICHLIWLDYDYNLDRSIIADVSSAAGQLSVGSILIITVDVEPPDLENVEGEGRPQGWFYHFSHEAGQYFDAGWTERDFARSQLARRNTEILEKAIGAGLTGRYDVEFFPIFHFLYGDGHTMLTIGGVLGGDQERRMMAGCDFPHCTFIRRDLSQEPYTIPMPILTRKERAYLDQYMPSDDAWRPSQFTLSKDDIFGYREIYRFFPSYAELLLG